MHTIGLTGSIAMGKSTTLGMFADLGCAVFDADQAVHDLYAKGGAAVAAIAARFRGVVKAGVVDRARLSELAVVDPSVLRQLEEIVHPLVHEAEIRFVEHHRAKGTDIVILDIPLLFEAGREEQFDTIVVVSAPAEVQRQRALARPGMSAAKLERILARQLPDSQKRRRADYVVETANGLDAARAQVTEIVANIRAETAKSPGKSGNA